MDELNPNDEQKQYILEAFYEGTSEIKKLTELYCNKYHPDASSKQRDGRSVYGRAVKKILAEEGKKAKSSHDYEAVKASLSEEDKEFANNNREFMSAVDMARILEDDSTITNFHKKAILLEEYLKTLEPIPRDDGELENTLNQYLPPKTFASAITTINKYVLNGIDKKKITGHEKVCINALIRYLSTYRFNHQINNYDTQSDRNLFESSFVRYTSDKGDLTQEEVDQYIVLSAEVVIASNIQRRIRRMNRLLDLNADDTEGRRMSMSLVQAISDAQTEYNQCVNRQQKLLESLKEKRSDRLKKQIKENASILNLVQMWKSEESRQKMIKLAENRKKAIKDEVQNLSSIDELKARIMGISEDEVLNG
jgi:hypothetical protein